MRAHGDTRGQRSFFHRPAYLRIANRAGGALARAGALRYPLEREALEAVARSDARHDNFGPDDYVQPLERLLASYRDEARLNFIGEAMAFTYTRQLLTNRLLVEKVRAERADVASQGVDRPVFIVGLPRTGSTIVYELSALEPRFRAPMTWEVMFPERPAGAADYEGGRARRAEGMLRWLDRLSPEFKRIHPMGGALPQECIMILSLAFRSVQFHTSNDVPGYQDWLLDADLMPAYRYHLRFLQHLQAMDEQRGRHWLLKAPAHLFGLDALFRTYPDAVVVQTHRRPSEVVASVSSLSASVRQAFSEHLDLEELGRSSCALWTRALGDSMDFRDAHPELADRFLDVRYTDFMAAPVDTIAAISAHAGLGFDQAARQRVRDYLAAHPQAKHGRHSYALSDFGLEAEAVDAQFGRYVARFGLGD